MRALEITFYLILLIALPSSLVLADALYDASTRTPDTNFFVYEGTDSENNTPPSVITSPSSAISSYTGINSFDGSSYSYSVPQNGKHGQVRFQLTIDETAADLTQIDFNWQGSGVNSKSSQTDGAAFYLWNDSSSAYELLALSTSSSAITLSGSVTSSFANYLGGASSNTLTLIVVTSDKRTGNKNNILSTNYFSVSTTTGAVAAADHLILTLSNTGLFCLDHSITATVYDSANTVFTTYDQQITLDSQSSNGTWSLTSGNGTFADITADDGLATYTFASSDNGVASFNLSYRQGTTPINVDMYQTSTTTIRDDDTEGDIAFSPSGFTITDSVLSNPPPNPIDGTIATQEAGTAFNLYLAAYGQTATDTTCGVIEAYTGNKNVFFWSDYSSPTTGTLTPTVNASSIAATEGAAAAQTVTFNNGQASVSVKYKDVGAISVNAKDIDPSGNITGNTANFVVKPADFVISVTGNPAAADASGSAFKKAGESFTAVVQVVDSEGDVTPNYGNESEGIIISSTTLVAPVGGRNGTLDDGAITNGSAFTVTGTAGIFSGSTFAFDEVGIIKLTAEVADNDYLGTGSNVTGTETGSVGRFTPWRLAVLSNSPLFRDGLLTWSCAMTYQGQAFGYGSGLDPTFTIEAQNSSDAATFNYGDDFWMLSTDLSSRIYSNNTAGVVAGLSFDPATATVAISGTADLSDGQGIITISNEEITYDKATIIPSSADIPFATDIDLDLMAAKLTDSDSICYDPDNDLTCDGYTLAGITGTDVHFGRLSMENGFGSELSNISINVKAESWNGTAFITNTLDSCSDNAVVTGWAGFDLTDYTGNLISGETTDSFSGFTAGVGTLILTAPGAGNDGTVRITLNGPPWLQYDYDGDGSAEDVRSVASFGIWQGRRPVIIYQESYRN